MVRQLHCQLHSQDGSQTTSLPSLTPMGSLQVGSFGRWLSGLAGYAKAWKNREAHGAMSFSYSAAKSDPAPLTQRTP